MSPFTADSKILNKVLDGDSAIWKDLHGPIESIRIFDRKAADSKDQITAFAIEIKTNESTKTCTGVYSVEAKWDFMELKSVLVTKMKTT
jgi:hypothetical protein